MKNALQITSLAAYASETKNVILTYRRPCFAQHGHSLVTLYVRFLSQIGEHLTGEFIRKIHAASGNLFTDSWSWQSFVTSYYVCNRLFPLDLRNKIQLLSRCFCYSWLVCLLSFRLRNVPFVKKVKGNHRFQKYASSQGLGGYFRNPGFDQTKYLNGKRDFFTFLSGIREIVTTKIL